MVRLVRTRVVFFCLQKYRIAAVCGLTVMCVLSTSEARGDALSFERVRERLVAITCETKDQSDQKLKVGTSSGFFVSPLGDIVTTFHLLKNEMIKQYDPHHIACWISIGSTESRGEKAPGMLQVEEKGHDETHDLLHLKVKNGRSDYKYFAVSENPRRDVRGRGAIDTAGFPESVPSKGETTQVTSMHGPEHNEELWTINSEIQSGQSGSPVFLRENLKVVGVIKGQDKAYARQGYMIPSDYIVRLVPDVKNYHGKDSPAGRLRIEVNIAMPRDQESKPLGWYIENDKGGTDKEVKKCFYPSPGWEIDRASVHLEQPIRKSIRSDFVGVSFKQDCPLGLTGIVRNEQWFLFAEEVGYLDLRGNYIEVKQQPREQQVQVFDKEVYPGALSHALPDGTQNYKVTLFDPDGKPIAELSGEGEDGRLEIKNDAGLKVLSINVLD